MKAAQLVEDAGIADGKRIIADFAAGGFVKSYALSIETLDTHGDGTVVLGPKIPKTMWKRIVQAGRATDVWASGTVHLAGAAIITGITFKPDSIDWLIAHHTDARPPVPLRRKAPPMDVAPIASEPEDEVGEIDKTDVQHKRRQADPSVIKPGAIVATIAEAQIALGYSRGTITKLINNGTLKRVESDERAVRITTASIWAYVGAIDPGVTANRTGQR